MLTFNDVNRDIKAMLEGISETNRPVPSVINVIKFSLILPLTGITLSAMTFWIVCAMSNHRDCSIGLFIDNFISGKATSVYLAIFVGFFQVVMLAPYIRLFHSLPQGLRENTPLIVHLRNVALRGVVLYVALLLFTCFMAFHYPVFLFATPVVMCLAIFATCISVDILVARFGVGAVITKLMKY
ncbi:hypothetical protein L8S23_21610 [Enterobacter bugandensis]|uniref:hypothetical protein n=1 Tax=Enterobacter bugandensis TaxID=881260 RepID=UPI0020044C61|nr:hypothetical protein [Enterobacter bugandensis]MCK6879772.1 hypothetical protein [Enterobacter bugandensis]